MRLALERGPGNVPDADIAAATGVPLGVYHSCFSSAEQAIVAAVVDEQKARLVSEVAARPPRVPLRRAVTDAYASPGVRRSGEMHLIVAHPALRDEYLKTAASIEGELTAVIAERLGTDRRNATWPATSIAIQVRVALKEWLKSVDASAAADEFPNPPTGLAPPAVPHDVRAHTRCRGTQSR